MSHKGSLESIQDQDGATCESDKQDLPKSWKTLLSDHLESTSVHNVSPKATKHPNHPVSKLIPTLSKYSNTPELLQVCLSS